MRVYPSPAKPKILFVTPFWPHRTSIGSEVRAGLALEALRQHGDVDVAVLDDGELSGDKIKGSMQAPQPPAVWRVEPKARSGWQGKLRWLLDPTLSHPFGCGVSAADVATVQMNLARYDLTWFFKLRSPLMFPTVRWPRAVLDIDDVPSTYERAILDGELKLPARLQAWARWWSWRRRERHLGEWFDGLTVCSPGDRTYLQQLGVRTDIKVIPNGVTRPLVEPLRNPTEPPRIGFIGLFSYPPNHKGIAWFARECWPRIKAQIPDARLRLVGRGSEAEFRPAGPDIDGLGWVADPTEEISTWSASVVPIHLGAGTRVKIAQGFSQKCPIVSTTLGAYGYKVRDGEELLLADSPEAFANACVRLMREPSIGNQLAERAWQRFLAEWSWDAIRPQVWAAAEACLRKNHRLPSPAE